jgi:hypothetical protein
MVLNEEPLPFWNFFRDSFDFKLKYTSTCSAWLLKKLIDYLFFGAVWKTLVLCCTIVCILYCSEVTLKTTYTMEYFQKSLRAERKRKHILFLLYIFTPSRRNIHLQQDAD